MTLRREVALVARYELQPVPLGNSGLKGVGELPPIIPAQGRGEIGNRLINAKRRKAIEELNGLARVASLEPSKDLRT